MSKKKFKDNNSVAKPLALLFQCPRKTVLTDHKHPTAKPRKSLRTFLEKILLSIVWSWRLQWVSLCQPCNPKSDLFGLNFGCQDKGVEGRFGEQSLQHLRTHATELGAPFLPHPNCRARDTAILSQLGDVKVALWTLSSKAGLQGARAGPTSRSHSSAPRHEMCCGIFMTSVHISGRSRKAYSPRYSHEQARGTGHVVSMLSPRFQ